MNGRRRYTKKRSTSQLEKYLVPLASKHSFLVGKFIKELGLATELSCIANMKQVTLSYNQDSLLSFMRKILVDLLYVLVEKLGDGTNLFPIPIEEKRSLCVLPDQKTILSLGFKNLKYAIIHSCLRLKRNVDEGKFSHKEFAPGLISDIESAFKTLCNPDITKAQSASFSPSTTIAQIASVPWEKSTSHAITQVKELNKPGCSSYALKETIDKPCKVSASIAKIKSGFTEKIKSTNEKFNKPGCGSYVSQELRVMLREAPASHAITQAQTAKELNKPCYSSYVSQQLKHKVAVPNRELPRQTQATSNLPYGGGISSYSSGSHEDNSKTKDQSALSEMISSEPVKGVEDTDLLLALSEGFEIPPSPAQSVSTSQTHKEDEIIFNNPNTPELTEILKEFPDEEITSFLLSEIDSVESHGKSSISLGK